MGSWCCEGTASKAVRGVEEFGPVSSGLLIEPGKGTLSSCNEDNVPMVRDPEGSYFFAKA